MELLKRLKDNLTMGELDVSREVANIEEDALIINSSELAVAAGAARSMVTTTLRMLSICGIIECKSMGAKGTYLKIVDRKALNYIINRG